MIFEHHEVFFFLVENRRVESVISTVIRTAVWFSDCVVITFLRSIVIFYVMGF